MKSEKAKAYINENEMDAANLVDKDGCGWAVVGIHHARKAVELAEQEAEERIRHKAAEAFKSGCVFRDQRCKHECKGCSRLKHFIQKLNEE